MEQPKNGEKVRLLELEYQECQEGYNNRDSIVPQEMSYIVLSFTVLAAVLGFVITILRPDPLWLRIIVGIIGLLGFFSLTAFLVDIQACLSCKSALRQRSMEIEEILSPNSSAKGRRPLCIWSNVMPNRRKRAEERWLKSLPILRQISPEGDDLFIWTTRAALILWVALVVFSGIYGPGIVPTN